MSRKHHDHQPNPQPKAAPVTEAEVTSADEAVIAAESEGMTPQADPSAEATQGAAGLAAPASVVEKLEREIGEWKDRALRASADFDNYRKRAVKERDEAAGRGQAQAFERII